eukprot:tig00020563_g11319.t1
MTTLGSGIWGVVAVATLVNPHARGALVSAFENLKGSQHVQPERGQHSGQALAAPPPRARPPVPAPALAAPGARAP